MAGYGQPYSVRFMSGTNTASRRETFTVPDGKRAVVRSAFFRVGAIDQRWLYVYVHGIIVIYWQPTAAYSSVQYSPRWTAYEGETIVCEPHGGGFSYALDGYLLADSDGRPDDADNVIEPIAAGTLPAAATGPEAAAAGA